ncbi:MAG: nicotinate phosphoribosyltransferase, partial [bacterium]
LKQIEGVVVTQKMIEDASVKFKSHFFGNETFNRSGWETIVNDYGGKLPVKIKAVPEGSVVSVNNVLMTVENTGGKETAWLTNYLETFLSRIWYPCTVATKSYNIKKIINRYLDETASNKDLLPFLLHDFGSRGVSSQESAAIGGAAHLVNFLGTDTVVAMDFVNDNYNVPYEGIGHSVFATEHSLMTSLGEEGESEIIQNILDKNPLGIVSVVADSYNYYRNVSEYVGQKFKKQIIDRYNSSNGIPTKYVIRPDSITSNHPTPEDLVVWTYEQLERDYGVTINEKGYKELHPAVGVIWGDGIDIDGVEKILEALKFNKYATTGMIFGMGGSLLQRLNRDTARFAFKCSAQKQNGKWVDIMKNPLDQTKKSKAGRLKLVENPKNYFKTLKVENENFENDFMETVFENGSIVKNYTFNEIRKRVNF